MKILQKKYCRCSSLQNWLIVALSVIATAGIMAAHDYAAQVDKLAADLDTARAQVVTLETALAEMETDKPDIELTVTDLGEFEVTHYAETGNRTKSGTWPSVGRTVAVDPEVIPLGSVLYVEGYGVLVAEDTGGAIKGKCLDVYVADAGEAVRMGRVEARVWRIGEN